MLEKKVVVAEYASSEEAQVGRFRLESEEIACRLTPDGFLPIQIFVEESQAEKAKAILAANEPLELDENWKAQAESAVEGWICHFCDTLVEESATECPECATPRRIRKKKRK